jgi:hypothetical protein
LVDSERFALANTVRTEDGTLLPPTRVTTGEQQLLASLPHLVRTDTARDLILGDTIGQGGMGVVRVADQTALGRRVAVKTLRADQRDPALALYLVREAWITGGLEHPNIIPIYALGLDEVGLPMIVMKRVEGTPWSARLKSGEHELKWHLRILTQVCRAVELAASRGIIHRDLKPDNVMIGPFGEVYVLDWGIAVSLVDDHGGRLPLAKEVRGISGTPSYMAPEMVTETGEGLGPHTDVYLLGAILHELITKEPRHQGATVQAILLSALRSAPVDYGPDLPAELAAIANRATRLAPEDRFESAAAFREAIELFLDREGSRRLVEQGEQRLKSWSTLVEDGRATPAQVSALYHETRFAFQQALLAWPQNSAAEAGLQACLQQKLEHDLAHDELESALLVLGDLGAGRPELAEKLSEVRGRVERRRQELEALRALQTGRNLDTGRRTRAFLMTLIGVGAGAIPVVAHLRISAGQATGFTYYELTTAIKLFVGAGLILWARESLSRTQINRQLTAILAMVGLWELATWLFVEELGNPIEHALFINLATFFLVSGTVSVTVDRRMAFPTLVYGVGAIVAGARPHWIHLCLGLTHFFASMTAAFIWRPARIRGPDPPPPPKGVKAT